MSSVPIFVEPIAITAGMITSTNVGAGDDPAAYGAGTTYAAGAQVTSGESIYQSVQDANTGHPVTDAAWWVLVGAINRLKMFDLKIGSQTRNAGAIVVQITPGVIIDVVALKNIDGLYARVVQTTAEEGVVYDRITPLDAPVADWYDYFFGPIILQREALFADVKPYTDAVLTVTIDQTGGTAGCGEMVIGSALKAGITQLGVRAGIDDYSRITLDDFGVRDIVERDFSQNLECTVYVESGWSGTLRELLTRNRAKPILLVPGDSRADMQVYGFAESWACVLTYPGLDVFSITMKGLT